MAVLPLELCRNSDEWQWQRFCTNLVKKARVRAESPTAQWNCIKEILNSLFIPVQWGLAIPRSAAATN
jgi:hypothetical protein